MGSTLEFSEGTEDADSSLIDLTLPDQDLEILIAALTWVLFGTLFGVTNLNRLDL